eukprot:m.76873 g.76873  ORF g.76873 m.76873 type:complete len:405 (-) comp24947_c0_seq1:283-1497(-)
MLISVKSFHMLHLIAMLGVEALAFESKPNRIPDPTAAESWTPLWQNKGSYDAVMCESTPFWWPKDQRMYLMESVCTGPLDTPGWKNKYGYYWGHAEQWFPEYKGHSYIRIRDLKTGDIVSNISTSIGFGFGAAFVDYDHGMLWISATPNDRVFPHNTTRPYGPPHKFCGHWECGVFVFNSSNLLDWNRTETDITWSGPNTDIGRVYVSPKYPTPSNLPQHRYVMATEDGTWIVNNNADGDLTKGWSTLTKDKAHGGVLACPSVQYLPSDGYYYTVSGGNVIPLKRSRDLLSWETAGLMFIQPSEDDVLTASSIMTSAAENLIRGNANLSFPFRSKWDHDANDADWCCESWGGASPEKGGPNISYVLWGADGQGASGWTQGPEGFAAIGTANVTLEKLLQSYFPT